MKTKILFISIICCGIFALASTTQAATLYVDDNNCSDSRTYTQVQSPTTPWCTIQKAADNVVAGDTVIVADGTYLDTNSDDFVVSLARSGSAGAYITFQSKNIHGAIIDCQNATDSYGFYYGAGSYNAIKGFEIKNCGAGVGSTSVASYVTIQGNKIHHMSLDGMFIFNANYPTIDGNVIYDVYTNDGSNQNHGIYIRGITNNATVTNNIIYNIPNGWPIHLYWKGGTDPAPGTQNNNKIINNTFADTNANADGHIIIAVPSPGLIIQNNISYNPRTSMIYTSIYSNSGNTLTIRNNLTNKSVMCTGAYCPSLSGFTNYINTNPLLKDPINKDFHLQSTSPAIGKGFLTNAPTYDFDGVPRGSSIDIGAYEFVGSDTTPPAAPTGLAVQ